MSLLPIYEGRFDRFGSRFGNIIDPDHFLGRTAFDIPAKSFPLTNLQKSGEAYAIELLVPGFDRNGIKVTVVDGVLTIKGEKQHQGIPDDNHFVSKESGIESFERKFHIQKQHLGHHMEAFFENGILRIVFYNRQDQVLSQQKRIPVSEI